MPRDDRDALIRAVRELHGVADRLGVRRLQVTIYGADPPANFEPNVVMVSADARLGPPALGRSGPCPGVDLAESAVADFAAALNALVDQAAKVKGI